MMIDQYTGLYCVIGNPVRHSLGPAMQNAAFREKGINAVYLAFEATDAGACIKGVRSLGIRGLSVTIPFKTDIIPFLDEVDDLALRIGAVNTVVNKEGRLRGYNTDAYGALMALEEKTEVPGKRVVIIGAGGASRAVGYILKEKGATVVVSNRSQVRGMVLCRDLGCEFIAPDKLHDVHADIIINTTPVGMSPDIDKSPVPEKIFKEGMTAMDIIYNPLKTRFLAAAKARGCEIVNGLSMFVYQGAEQFRLWTGIKAPVEVMTAAVEKELSN
ncbi:MAG: shikimate dehydrogenase [Deltaproteobacteria bacterium]|nr:shikimate dehydrogenase [Deltaproteobacteria bacterium]